MFMQNVGKTIKVDMDTLLLIVDEAIGYVDRLLHSGEIKKYLQHDRLVLKAKFSSVISITNPDRSTALFNTLFMSFPWEEKDEIIKHFSLLNDMLGGVNPS
ncbi:MAG TPA: hypothetical protein DDZ89_17110, partial [Clostridiales bacterium]|nr:hypothetical protein [Clostridiales bacterium]